jgi:hypothetical protein
MPKRKKKPLTDEEQKERWRDFLLRQAAKDELSTIGWVDFEARFGPEKTAEYKALAAEYAVRWEKRHKRKRPAEQGMGFGDIMKGAMKGK